MKPLKVWTPAAMAGALCVAFGFAACGGSSSSSGMGSGGGVSKAEAVSQMLGATGFAGGAVERVRAASFQPNTANTVDISSSVPCPGGGSMMISGTMTATPNGAGTASTMSGSMNGSFGSGCKAGGYAFSGSWIETFDMTDAMGSTQLTLNGTVGVPNSTIMIDGTSCAVNMTDTFNNNVYDMGTGVMSGSMSYSGSACGAAAASGSCNMMTHNCQ